jgi:TolB-like protein/Tfp pilus assembly protein PilF
MAKGRPFLLPIVIDDTRDTDAHVPDSFTEVQWTRLKGGETPPAFVVRVRKLLSGEPGEKSKDSGSDVGASLEDARGHRQAALLKKSRPWLIPAILGAAALAALALWQPWKKSAPPATGTAPAAQTEAQKLVQQAQNVYAKGDQLDRETLVLADDLVKRALVLDPAEPSAWELAARLSYFLVWQGFDGSEARKADLQRQAARARALAPESVTAQLAVVNAQLALAFSNFQSVSNRQTMEAIERDLLVMAERAPHDYQVQQALGQTYRFLKKPDEALRAMQRSLELSGGDPSVSADMINVLLRRKRYAEAEAMVAPALARRPVGRILVLDALFKTIWRGDLPAAQAALATWPGWLLREDRGAFAAWQTWMWSGRPDLALDVASRLPRDYLRDNWFTGPRAVLTARAHELAGHQEAAQADWRIVVRLADRELTGALEDDAPALFWKAWAQSRLGDQAGALAITALLQQRNLDSAVFFRTTSIALLWSTLGRTDLAAEHLRANANAIDDAYAVTRKMLELDPAYAPLRADPQFAALAAAALAPVVADPAPSSLLPAPALPPAADAKSVAVLAFANLSDDKANEYFSDGISEELLNVLAKVPGLKVSARTSAFYFKGKEVPIPEIARQLGVAYVVEGSVRKQGDKVRITAQLIKADGGFHVWSDTFTRDLKDIFAVQDEIAGLIAKNLSLKLGARSPRAAIVVSPQAFELYVQARQVWSLRTSGGFAQAEQLLNRALEIAPDFVRARAALIDVMQMRSLREGRIGSFGQRNLPELDRLLEHVRGVLAIEPDLAEAHATLGTTLLAKWNMAEAERAYRRATELNPNYATGRHWLGMYLAQEGRMTEALAELKLASELDPLSFIIVDNYGWLLYLAGRHREALRMLDRALALNPGFDQTKRIKALTLAALGRVSEAAELARETKSLDREMDIYMLGVLGLRAEAETLRAGLEARTITNRFRALLAAGRQEEALAALDDPSGVGYGDCIELSYHPFFDPVRDDPRFIRYLAALGQTEADARAQAWRAAHPPEKPEAKK